MTERIRRVRSESEHKGKINLKWSQDSIQKFDKEISLDKGPRSFKLM